MDEVQRSAEERCDHKDEWVGTSDGIHYHTEACWSCILDAYFEHRDAQ